MEHPSGDSLEPATKLGLLDTDDWEALSTNLGRKLPSTVLLDTIEEHLPVGGYLEPVSLEMPDVPAKISTGKLVELCTSRTGGPPFVSG